MKNMRKVVSILLLVCVLSSILMVSASAYDGSTLDFTVMSEGKAGNTYNITTAQGLNLATAFKPADGDASHYVVHWKVNDNPISTTGDSFYFNGQNYAAGTYLVSAFAEDANKPTEVAAKTGDVKIVVSDAAPELTGVVFNTESVQLKGYISYNPVYAIKIPAEAEGTIEYSISPAGVAEYNPVTQTLIAKGAGQATLTATVGGFTASIPVYVTIPVSGVTIDTPYLNAVNGSPDATINYTVISDGASYPTLQWTSDNNRVASVVADDNTGHATVRFNGSNGTATITAYSTDGTAVNGKCLITVEGGEKTFVEVTPVKADLFVGESVTLTAYVSGKTAEGDTAYFDHWYCSSSAVQLTHDGNVATVKAISAVNSPIEVRAYSNDSKYGYALIYISKADPLELTASDTIVKSGKTVVVSVANARPNETFTWSYSPEDYSFVRSTSVKGNNFSLVGGDLEGTVIVNCVSNNDSTRTASVMVGVNSVDPYGNAAIIPNTVSWTRGNGDLSFQITPAAHWTYLDNQFLNLKSTSLVTYWNGTLTLKAAYLNTLSNGNHTLKVYTASDSDNNPTGLVYANVTISGNNAMGASATYGDNAHVKGAASNLYFNSATPISDVYISGKWIDPANFSLSSDGKTLTLISGFLNQLPYGTYTMQLNGANGTTQTTNFRIVTANYAPSTGDETNVGLWVAIMVLSGAGAISLIPKKKRAED